MDTAVAVSQLSVRYRGGFRSPAVQALTGVDFEVSPGAIVGILGPNGSGKTTLLKVLCGLLRPDSGSAVVLGASPGDRALVPRVGYQAEGSLPFPSLSGPDFLRYMGALMGLDRGLVDEQTRHWISRLDLDHAGRRPLGTYSLGMTRRLGLAAALLPGPDVLILDEPTSGLDPHGSLEVIRILEEVADRGTAVIMASHHLQEVEQLCGQIVILHQGRVAAAGSLDELLATGEHTLVMSGLDQSGLKSVEASVRDAGGQVVERRATRQHLFALFRRVGR